MGLVIRGLGTALPDQSITQTKALEVAQAVCCLNGEHEAALAVLYRQTGITTRHMIFAENVVADVLDGTTESKSQFVPVNTLRGQGPSTAVRMDHYVKAAVPLASAAAERALTEAHLPSHAVTHLVTVSCTGFSAPGVDVGLIKNLDLAATVQRVHVGFMGCHAAINGLRVSQGLASDPNACVLLCAVELCSLHYFYGWNPKKMVANALFADGAAAMIGSSDVWSYENKWRLEATGSCLFPNSEYAMTWKIGDNGFEMSLSTRVPALIADHLPMWLQGWLKQHGLRLEQIKSWAIHPGGPRIVNAVGDCLGLLQDALAVSRQVLDECGNMSSPTVLFILERLKAQQAPLPCVALAFGPGLAVETALFR